MRGDRPAAGDLQPAAKTGEAAAAWSRRSLRRRHARCGSRIVMDVNKPVRIAGLCDRARGGQPGGCVDLARPTATASLKTSRRKVACAGATASGVERESAQGDPRPIVVLDPGHGASTTRRRRQREMEKDIVLEFSTAFARSA